MALIEILEVHRHYQLGKTLVRALRGVSLQVDSGEFMALWGPSGSGKSTLCNLLSGIDLPSRGTVRIGGIDLGAVPDDVLALHRNRMVGFIFQQFNLLPVLSARENVMIPLLLRGEPRQSSLHRANDLLRELGVAGLANKRPDHLAGGERQRVAIARALAGDPAIVVADEPTANLDTANAIKIFALMRQLNLSRGTTFVVATHDRRLLDRVDRLVRLRDGRIVEDRGSEAA